MITLDTEHTYSVSEADKIVEDAFKLGSTGNSKKLRYRNIISAFDIETTSFTDDIDNNNDIVLYNYLKGTTILISDLDIDLYKDIVPYGLKISKTKGYELDILYMDLVNLFPYYFPDDVISPDNQLKLIFDIYRENISVNADCYKHSIMYVWQFAIQGKVIIGRTWSEFCELIEKISKHTSLDNRMIVYVHNLQFEMQFIRFYLNWHKVFSISPRKPIYAITEDGIEFRCSYLLTNYNLETLAKNLQIYKIRKLVGDLDYSLYRTPKTPLTKEELAYCINDVLIVSAYIQECILKEGSIAKIPLTATGYCRRYVRNCCFYDKDKKKKGKKYNAYHAFIQSLRITGEEEYQQLRRCAAGGFTHSSAIHTNKIIDHAYRNSYIDSIDFTSSYPFVMLSEAEFPMSTGEVVKINSKEEFEYYLKYYFCIFDVTIKGLQPKMLNEHYISTSHCYERDNVVENNGRVVSADSISLSITGIDYQIIDKVYSMSSMDISRFRIYKKGYLPKDIILAIIKLYKDKTTLKGVEGKETEYLQGKALLNSTFGMMYTDPCRDEIIYADTWNIKKCNIAQTIEKYNKNGNRFTFYPWGIAICCLARKNLWSGILAFGDDYLYSDTDSIKCTNLEKHMNYINAYNANCKKKLQKMCSYYNIDYSELEPRTIEGELKPLGVWDIETKNDKKYLTFKTLGAKRYIYTQEAYDKETDTYYIALHMTVAGVAKKVAVPYLLSKYGIDGIFKAFDFGLEIPPDHTGKLTHAYIDHEEEGDIYDYLGNKYRYHSLSGIYLEKQGFKFSHQPVYEEFLKGVQYYK